MEHLNMTTNPTNRLPALLATRPPVQPVNDGVDHINISMSGATELGRKLTHFAFTPFIHPQYGPFKSMEGFWNYIKSATQDDNFRTLVGARAKSYAKTKKAVWRENFIEIITEANYQKIMQNEEIKQLMLDSSLPFSHYYLFGECQVQIFPEQSSWLCSGFEKIRNALRAGTEIPAMPLVAWDKRH